ncbi:RING-H2 finger protein ATL46-like [Canna indica]|uniref:RING-type E3 ubiquitin transferase n=1 Tax=Canna indica TaxID=4628 RepID=A0AAQ3Q474_9LILI|nr:RING-H2 finger protein ATL46-like [Canna indica]
MRKEMVVAQVKNSNGVPSHSFSRLSISSRDSLPLQSSQPPPTPSSPTSTRISPAVLFTIVILTLIFFISGLLHLFVRFLIKKRPSSSPSSTSSSPHYNGRRRAAELSGDGTGALQRQLRQLFHLHDSGLDQSFIDALPLFLYREILGSKDPFDCAVCLCEFEPDDKLRLLPVCGHAFHLNCIDTWLLSNSTCPLCRGAIFVQGLTVENPIFDIVDDLREEDGFSGCRGSGGDEIASEKRVFPVRLGKFKNLSNDDNGDYMDDCGSISDRRREVGETSSSSLDARRCFSMGYYQYVVADFNLQVALGGSSRNGDEMGTIGRGSFGHSNAESDEGKRLGIGCRDESFSVSKIWQWSDKKGKFPVFLDAAPDMSLPWMRTSVEESYP